MKKKFLVGLLAVVMCFTLTGCGEKEIIDPINGTDIENQEQGKNDDEKVNLELYSDDSKIVFDFSGVYKIVYYYEGNTINGLEYYFDYQDTETAKYAITALKSQYEAQDHVESVKQKGQYIIIKFTEEEYKDRTVEEVKQSYSYLEEVMENN